MIQPEGALATEWCYRQRKCSTSFLVFVNLALTGYELPRDEWLVGFGKCIGSA